MELKSIKLHIITVTHQNTIDFTKVKTSSFIKLQNLFNSLFLETTESKVNTNNNARSTNKATISEISKSNDNIAIIIPGTIIRSNT